MIIMRTYFSTQIPRELREAAQLDGCAEMRYLVRIVLPLSVPILAVVGLDTTPWACGTATLTRWSI